MVLGDATHFAMKDEVIMGMQSTSECFKATRRLQHLALSKSSELPDNLGLYLC
jgi:hypothetical protein